MKYLYSSDIIFQKLILLMKVILLIIVTLIYKYMTANNFVALWKKDEIERYYFRT